MGGCEVLWYLVGFTVGGPLLMVILDQIDRWWTHPTNQWCSHCLYCFCHTANRRRVRQDRKEWEVRNGKQRV